MLVIINVEATDRKFAVAERQITTGPNAQRSRSIHVATNEAPSTATLSTRLESRGAGRHPLECVVRTHRSWRVPFRTRTPLISAGGDTTPRGVTPRHMRGTASLTTCTNSQGKRRESRRCSRLFHKKARIPIYLQGPDANHTRGNRFRLCLSLVSSLRCNSAWVRAPSVATFTFRRLRNARWARSEYLACGLKFEFSGCRRQSAGTKG